MPKERVRRFRRAGVYQRDAEWNSYPALGGHGRGAASAGPSVVVVGFGGRAPGSAVADENSAAISTSQFRAGVGVTTQGLSDYDKRIRDEYFRPKQSSHGRRFGGRGETMFDKSGAPADVPPLEKAQSASFEQMLLSGGLAYVAPKLLDVFSSNPRGVEQSGYYVSGPSQGGISTAASFRPSAGLPGMRRDITNHFGVVTEVRVHPSGGRKLDAEYLQGGDGGLAFDTQAAEYNRYVHGDYDLEMSVHHPKRRRLYGIDAQSRARKLGGSLGGKLTSGWVGTFAHVDAEKGALVKYQDEQVGKRKRSEQRTEMKETFTKTQSVGSLIASKAHKLGIGMGASAVLGSVAQTGTAIAASAAIRAGGVGTLVAGGIAGGVSLLGGGWLETVGVGLATAATLYLLPFGPALFSPGTLSAAAGAIGASMIAPQLGPWFNSPSRVREIADVGPAAGLYPTPVRRIGDDGFPEDYGLQSPPDISGYVRADNGRTPELARRRVYDVSPVIASPPGLERSGMDEILEADDDGEAAHPMPDLEYVGAQHLAEDMPVPGPPVRYTGPGAFLDAARAGLRLNFPDLPYYVPPRDRIMIDGEQRYIYDVLAEHRESGAVRALRAYVDPIDESWSFVNNEDHEQYDVLREYRLNPVL